MISLTPPATMQGAASWLECSAYRHDYLRTDKVRSVDWALPRPMKAGLLHQARRLRPSLSAIQHRSRGSRHL